MITLHDRVVIVTGASSGIGKAIVRLFADEGAKVILAARNSERLSKIADEIACQGKECISIPVDIKDEQQVIELHQRVVDVYGRIDILINNAGIASASPV